MATQSSEAATNGKLKHASPDKRNKRRSPFTKRSVAEPVTPRELFGPHPAGRRRRSWITADVYVNAPWLSSSPFPDSPTMKRSERPMSSTANDALKVASNPVVEMGELWAEDGLARETVEHTASDASTTDHFLAVRWGRFGLVGVVVMSMSLPLSRWARRPCEDTTMRHGPLMGGPDSRTSRGCCAGFDLAEKRGMIRRFENQLSA
ncbi:MAG: hypothetical protein ACRD2W_22460 [Acidimicrobiales bacterium]